MKVNLLIGNSSSVLNGYLNIDVLGSPQSTDRIAGAIDNLDPLVDANECDHLLVLNILDKLPLQVRPKVLQHYMTKISHGGLLTISALDLMEASRLVYNGITDVMEINKLIYGIGNNTWSWLKSYIPCQDTIAMIMQGGQFLTESVKYDGPTYIINARRK